MIHIFGSQGTASRALLEAALEQAYGLFPLPVISHTHAGKPYFPDFPGIHFNLSHSGPLTLCALGDGPVGVDIEQIKPRRRDLPSYAFTREEQAAYLALGGDWPAFYRLWTKKEAWCKYTGQGLGPNFRTTPSEAGLHYTHYVGSDWLATVCGEEPPTEEILWLNLQTGEQHHGET